ncbi:response regulator transcription factor [Hathewaya massiliensis]|uniref:response regulator transcription factor n=1 Tax=Hathewaya massiliensis TaxID=1964382 RepID=UPI00115A153B|nr:response regulator transcription factor [Hathewaya massiliensis]
MIIEDEFRMRKLLKDYFKKEGFEVIEAEDGKEAMEIFKTENPDLIILDIMMPHIDGFTLCKYIREISAVPIIFLTAKSEDEDKLLGFKLGADEYVTKPFSPKVLVARCKSLLKRVNGTIGTTANNISINGLVINTPSREVTIDDEEIFLSPKEFDLLMYMIKNKGLVLTRDMILDNVWGMDYFGDLRTVDTHIKRLREKLKHKSNLISTVRGLGYKFEV